MANEAKGALFKNDKTKDGQPDWSGNVELTVDVLQSLLREAQANGGTYKARVAAWQKTGARGQYFSLALSPPFVRGAGGASPRPRNEF